eukprot:363818-Chlamydomonas_euryale.AAC.3
MSHLAFCVHKSEAQAMQRQVAQLPQHAQRFARLCCRHGDGADRSGGRAARTEQMRRSAMRRAFSRRTLSIGRGAAQPARAGCGAPLSDAVPTTKASSDVQRCCAETTWSWHDAERCRAQPVVLAAAPSRPPQPATATVPSATARVALLRATGERKRDSDRKVDS